QVIDRTSVPNDVVKWSCSLPIVKDNIDVWDCEVKVNKAILELSRRGGGPAHLNLPTTYTREYTTQRLPEYRKIERIFSDSKFPLMDKSKKIGVFVGAHNQWSKVETEILDRFCETNNAVVFCDHTSAYKGKYRVLYSLAAGQSSKRLIKET